MKQKNYFFIGTSVLILILIIIAGIYFSQKGLWVKFNSRGVASLISISDQLPSAPNNILTAAFDDCTGEYYKSETGDPLGCPKGYTPAGSIHVGKAVFPCEEKAEYYGKDYFGNYLKSGWLGLCSKDKSAIFVTKYDDCAELKITDCPLGYTEKKSFHIGASNKCNTNYWAGGGYDSTFEHAKNIKSGWIALCVKQGDDSVLLTESCPSGYQEKGFMKDYFGNTLELKFCVKSISQPPPTGNIKINAKAQCFNGCPNMQLWINNQIITSWTINNQDFYKTYETKYSGQINSLYLAFTNDYSIPLIGDRNLFVSQVIVDGKIYEVNAENFDYLKGKIQETQIQNPSTIPGQRYMYWEGALKLKKNLVNPLSNPILTADSYMTRNPNPQNVSSFGYGTMFVLYGLEKTYNNTGDVKYYNYIKNLIDSGVDNNGNITKIDWSNVSVNHVAVGLPILFLYEKTGEEKYLKAAKKLADDQLWQLPKTSDGTFVHMAFLKDMVWADTMFMIGPFMGRMGKITGDTKYYDEGANQFILHAKHLQDETNGLLYHGWDEDGNTSPMYNWYPNPETHRSCCFWSRANGWYFMGLVDFLDYLPKNHPKRAQLLEILNKQAQGLAVTQGPVIGLWFQVLDKRDDPGNWRETSGSAMFVYGIHKAVRKGYLNKSYLENANKGFKGLLTKMYLDNNNLTVINDTCVGTGILKSYDSYIARPKNQNDEHGIGAYLLASNEVMFSR